MLVPVTSKTLLTGCSSCNERGEVQLVCPCGDTFSPQRGMVEQHYDEKHAEEGCCPWKSRGCTNCAQVRPRQLLQLQIELTQTALRTSRHIFATSIASLTSHAPFV
jgi:hypothetical protein